MQNLHKRYKLAGLMSVLLLCFSAQAKAQVDRLTNASTDEAEFDTTSTQKSILLLALKSSGSIDQSTAKLLDELLAVELGKYRSQLKTLSSADVKRILELESAKTIAGCDDESCMTEIAQALGARYVINGRIGEIGSQKIMTLNLYDSEKTEYLHRLQFKDSKLEGLTSRMEASVAEVVAPLLTQDATSSSSSASMSPLIWNGAMITTALAIAAGGIVFDVASPTSYDDKITAADVVGPALYLGVAPLVAIGGILLNPFSGE